MIQGIKHKIREIKDVHQAVWALTDCKTVSSINRKLKISPFQKNKQTWCVINQQFNNSNAQENN